MAFDSLKALEGAEKLDCGTSTITEIMEIGKKLVDKQLERGNHLTAVTVTKDNLHLVFAKVLDKDDINACLYDFNSSSEPILVFGPNVYDPRMEGLDAIHWLEVVKNASYQFEISLVSADLLGTLSTSTRLSQRIKDLKGDLEHRFQKKVHTDPSSN